MVYGTVFVFVYLYTRVLALYPLVFVLIPPRGGIVLNCVMWRFSLASAAKTAVVRAMFTGIRVRSDEILRALRKGKESGRG